MDFRIADTFTDSLARLTGDEQKLAKTAAFDLQMDPASPGMQFHRLTKSKDPNFWSVRVGSDLRLIVHKTASSLMLCYVDHHDAAYRWAERRKIERHPQTGAAQLVEVRETVREIVVPRYVEGAGEPAPLGRGSFAVLSPSGASAAQDDTGGAKPLFSDIPDWLFLSYGVPPEWMDDVRAATEDTLFDVAEHLPAEAAEALLNLATGTKPPLGLPPEVRIADAPPPTIEDAFKHPDAQRRFRVIESAVELERALEAPWEKWTIFLHPAQRQLVERDYSGPVRISGSAGTGKTIVALHRAVQLARANEDGRVLLTTLSDTLANALRPRLRLLIGNEPRIAERLEVHSTTAIGRRLYEVHFGKVNLASELDQRSLLMESALAAGSQKFSLHFLWTEWQTVVDAWQLDSWESYRDVKRLGRKTRLAEKQRLLLWDLFERMRATLQQRGLITESAMFHKLATKIATLPRPTFDYVIVDEAQDVSVGELRFLAALGAGRPNALFFTGDLGQRIFQQPFSWTSLGVDIRGRSSRLRINYRTSHQIRSHADRLLGPELSDVDGVTEERKGTISVFEGVTPTIAVEKDETAERDRVAAWIRERIEEGLRPHELAIFVRSENEIPRAEAAAKAADVPFVILTDQMETKHNHLTIATMHRAKGLEFRAVAVMACDDEIIPSQERIDTVSDESELDEVYQTERHLLYVACTRARDWLLVSGVGAGSEFIGDMAVC
ncbi:MAG: 3'-5' exonuclease [Thermoanaerobaculia bacterium]